MTYYEQIKEKMQAIVQEHQLDQESITISSSVLSTEEAIGITERKDFPLIKGKEKLINASFRGAVGQAFTDQPAVFKGSISQVMALDLDQNNNRALFIATSNAILRHLGLISNTVHCKNDGPENCAREMRDHLLLHYPGARIGLVGLQPAILDHLQAVFSVRVLDLDPDNIGQKKYGVLIEDGETGLEDVVQWADLMLVTGSTSVNGTILKFLSLDKPVIFFGTTVAGIAYLLDLPRLCWSSS